MQQCSTLCLPRVTICSHSSSLHTVNTTCRLGYLPPSVRAARISPKSRQAGGQRLCAPPLPSVMQRLHCPPYPVSPVLSLLHQQERCRQGSSLSQAPPLQSGIRATGTWGVSMHTVSSRAHVVGSCWEVYIRDRCVFMLICFHMLA